MNKHLKAITAVLVIAIVVGCVSSATKRALEESRDRLSEARAELKVALAEGRDVSELRGEIANLKEQKEALEKKAAEEKASSWKTTGTVVGGLMQAFSGPSAAIPVAGPGIAVALLALGKILSGSAAAKKEVVA